MFRVIQLSLLVVAIGLSTAVAQSKKPKDDYSMRPTTAFTENAGQWDSRVLFKANCRGMVVWLTTQGTYYQFQRSKNLRRHDKVNRYENQFFPGDETNREVYEQMSIRTIIEGGDASAVARGEVELSFKSNYFIGNDPTKWRTNVANYASVVVPDIYPGIDLKYYSTDDGRLEYDFLVSPAADYRQIRISFHGANSVEIDESSDLRIGTDWNSITEQHPKIYQEIAGKRRQISGQFRLSPGGIVSFELDDDYDSSLPVIIDPTIVYSTLLGGSFYDGGFGIAVDNAGSAYVVG